MDLSLPVRPSLFLLLIFPLLRLYADESPEKWADLRLREVTRGETSGLAVLVARDGKILFQGAYGFADLETNSPVTVETKFRIGSVSKQFTAAAILRLVEEKKLALSDPLSKFYPGFARGKEITLHHLLTHTSGLHSYTEKPDFMAGVTDAIEPGKLIASFEKDPADFAPGTGFHYNNSAYFLAGEIVGQVSGKSFADYLRVTFFEPLGMGNTGIYVNAAPPMGMAKGYSFSEGKLAPALDWDMSRAGGAGALYSTVNDLFRWNEALHGGRVINPDSLKLATTAIQLPAGVDGLNYGYGLLMFRMQGLPAIGHGGGLHGWSSNLLWLPHQRSTVVVLANSMPSPPGQQPDAISSQLVERFLADEIKKLPTLSEDKRVDPKTFTAFTGRYDYKTAILTVTQEDGHLFAQLTGQPKVEIFPKAPNEFFWKAADAQVVFLRNDQGEVVAAQHTQNGATFKAPKLGVGAIKLSAEQLEPFTGQYQYAPGVILTVRRDGDLLFAQLTAQPEFPIFPKSATEFEWRVVPAKVQFVMGEDGKVTKAIHTQNGNSFPAPKIK